MNYGKLTAGTTKTAIDTAKPSEKGEIITYLSRMGDVLEQILERHQLVAVFILGVNIVVDSDVAHIIGREYLLDIKTGVQLVSSKAGKILCDDDGDVAVAHVIHHLFKGWAIEIRAGIAIVGCCTERTNKFTPCRIPGARLPSEFQSHRQGSAGYPCARLGRW